MEGDGGGWSGGRSVEPPSIRSAQGIRVLRADDWEDSSGAPKELNMKTSQLMGSSAYERESLSLPDEVQ